MGSVTPPPTAPGQPAAGGAPPPRPGRESPYRFTDRSVSMGPSGTAILLPLVGAAVGAWLYLKPPSSVGPQSLQKYMGFESNLESVTPRNCAPPGCAAVYLTPAAGKNSTDALPGAFALSEELSRQGVECFVILGQEPLAEAVKRARSMHRTVLFDPTGAWAKESGIEKPPYWIVWRTGGKVRRRSEGPLSAADVLAALR
jgi:hypothetical protein